MNRIVISVRRVPGSGKSFICSKVSKYIACLDTDDYFTKAFNLIKSDKNLSYKKIEKYAYKLLYEDISKYKIVVVVGITLLVNSTYTYYIKLTPKELEESYKRTLIRELNKYKTQTTSEVINNIKKFDVKTMDIYLNITFNIAVVPTHSSFMSYKKDYNRGITISKLNNVTIMPQEKIIDEILSIFHSK
jgi:hypothetical protein